MNDLLTKRCLGPCGRELPATEEFFSKHLSGKYGLQSRCRECRREENRLFVLSHPENKKAWDKKYANEHPEVRRRASLKYAQSDKGKNKQVKNWLENKYGLTEDQYQELWNKQNGLCAICGKPEETTQRLHVDHCHRTDTIRGLLCGKCNRGIGMFDDEQELLLKAAEYLRKTTDPSKLIPVRLSTPQKQVSVEAVKQLKSIGFTHQKIADTLACSAACVSKKLNGWPESEFALEEAA
jgi:hypothetical protein